MQLVENEVDQPIGHCQLPCGSGRVFFVVRIPMLFELDDTAGQKLEYAGHDLRPRIRRRKRVGHHLCQEQTTDEREKPGKHHFGQ